MGSQCFDFVRSTMSFLLRSTQRLILMSQNHNVAQMRPMSGGHDPDSYKWWKKVFFFVATPVIILGNINAFVLADPSEMDPPPFVPYDHLRIRTKKFPGEMAITLSFTILTPMHFLMVLKRIIELCLQQ